jgi:hypothetical protein
MHPRTAIWLLGLVLSATAQRFVRFIATDGKEYTGDAILPPGTTDAAYTKQAKVITGDILGAFQITNQVKVDSNSRLTRAVLIVWYTES